MTSVLTHVSAVNALLLAAFVMAAAMWADQMAFETDNFAAYGDTPRFGGDCDYATGVWADSDTWDSVRLRPQVYTRLAMPYRAAEHKPVLVENGYLITRCRVDLSALPKTGYAWLNPGVVFGPSAVYLNGRLKVVTEAKKFLEIPLNPDERGVDSQLVLVSKRDPLYKAAGLASLAPLAFGSGQAAADRILGISARLWLELPMARSNFCLGLLVLFAAAWLAGLRYQDVGWMLATLSVLAVVNATEYYVELLQMAWIRSLQILAYVPLTASFVAFAFAFLRLPVRQRLVELALVLATALYAAAHYTFYEANLIHLNTSLRLFWCISALGLTVAAALGLRQVKTLPPRRRIRVVTASTVYCLVAVLFVYLTCMLDKKALFTGNAANIAIAVAFAVLLGLDLVLFQRQYLTEREARQKTDHEVRRLQDKLTLGGAVQSLLLPDGDRHQVGAYQVECRYLPHESLAGDWYYHWTSGDRLILLLGDVTGKGPSAALAVAAITTVLYDVRRLGLTAEACVERLNEMLHGMFQGHLWTTLALVEAAPDGTVRYANLGAEGWVLIGAGWPELLSTRGNPLGSGPAPDLKWESARLTAGQGLLGLTDGYLEGSHRQRQWLRRLASAQVEAVDFDRIVQLAEDFRREIRIEDDRTIISLTYNPAADALPLGMGG